MKNQKGFSLIELLVVVIIIAIIAAIAIPSLLASRRAANESAAIATLRTLHSAQMTYQATTGNRIDFATNLAGLAGVNLIDSALASGTKSGYDYVVTANAATPFNEYCATADPDTASTGTNHFAVSNGNGGVVMTDPAALTCAAGILAPGGTPIE